MHLKFLLEVKLLHIRATRKKENSAKVIMLESQLKGKEKELSLNYSDMLPKEVCKLKLDLNEIGNHQGM